jgi:hypothetical protein
MIATALDELGARRLEIGTRSLAAGKQERSGCRASDALVVPCISGVAHVPTPALPFVRQPTSGASICQRGHTDTPSLMDVLRSRLPARCRVGSSGSIDGGRVEYRASVGRVALSQASALSELLVGAGWRCPSPARLCTSMAAAVEPAAMAVATDGACCTTTSPAA